MSKPTLGCFKEAIIRSYTNLWITKRTHCLLSFLAVAPFCLFGLLGLFKPFFHLTSSLNALPDHYFLASLAFLFSMFIWLVPCGVLWHRLYLKGLGGFLHKNFWRIFWRSTTMITYTLILLGMTLIITLLLLSIAYYILGHAGHMGLIEAIEYYSDTGKVPYPFTVGAVLLFSLYFLIRFSLAFSGRAVGCKTGFINSWHLTKHRGILMFAGHLLTSLPISLLIYGLYSAAKYYLPLTALLEGDSSLPAGYIIIFIFSPLIMLPIAMIASVTSHFYHYCGAASFPFKDCSELEDCSELKKYSDEIDNQ
jgi:hypothetical protein